MSLCRRCVVPEATPVLNSGVHLEVSEGAWKMCLHHIRYTGLYILIGENRAQLSLERQIRDLPSDVHQYTPSVHCCCLLSS